MDLKPESKEAVNKEIKKNDQNNSMFSIVCIARLD